VTAAIAEERRRATAIYLFRAHCHVIGCQQEYQIVDKPIAVRGRRSHVPIRHPRPICCYFVFIPHPTPTSTLVSRPALTNTPNRSSLDVYHGSRIHSHPLGSAHRPYRGHVHRDGVHDALPRGGHQVRDMSQTTQSTAAILTEADQYRTALGYVRIIIRKASV
jgi:hypothetical protein